MFKCTGDALVVFETERERYKVLYKFNSPLLWNGCGLTIPRYENRRLRVFKGLSPKDIIWENFEYSLTSKIMRRSLAIFLTLVFMVISIVASFILEVLKAAYFRATMVDVNNLVSIRNGITLLASFGISGVILVMTQALSLFVFCMSLTICLSMCRLGPVFNTC